MGIILFNAEWMSWNIFLAILAVFFGFAFLKSEKLILKIPFFILWFLFLPNTIYMITDMMYLPEQIVKVDNLYKIPLLFQYLGLLLISIVTFIFSLYPLNKALSKRKNKNKELKVIAVIFINYLIAFGVALGRIERLNSWDVFTNLAWVLESSINLLSRGDVLLISFAFGSAITCLYFSAVKFLRIK